MIVKFDKLFITKEDLLTIDRTNPANVAALFVNISSSYDINNDSNFIELLQFLMGEYQPISPMMRQNIKDRMIQNNKYNYIGKSYFKGATPDNDYTPNIPYEVEVIENDYSRLEDGFIKLWLKSGGADSLRPITLRLAKDGNYYIWSDSFIGLLTDIRKKESENPWA